MGKIKTFYLLSLSGFFVLGCQGQPSQIVMNTDQIPTTYENPLNPPMDQPVAEEIPTNKPAEKPTVPVVTDTPTDSPAVPEVAIEDDEPAATKPVLRYPKASPFILNAERIMITEGKKIGTPCNRYLMRVLEVSGYAKQSFLANDFDLYAKKHLKDARAIDFVNDGRQAESGRLKRHLWSYPERTPFIMQWSRTGVRGHVAIVERIKDKLIIYQANLNKHSARKDLTTIDRLLSGYNRRTLSVYSEF